MTQKGRSRRDDSETCSCARGLFRQCGDPAAGGYAGMTEIEKRALIALNNVSMRIASAGKRFRNDQCWHLENDADYKLTRKQARYLWLLIYTYRRQVKDAELRRFGEYVKVHDELPEIYLEGDHREKIQTKAAKRKQSIQIAPGGKEPKSPKRCKLTKSLF